MCSVFYVGENMIQKMKHLTQEIDKEAEKVKLERDIHPTDQALILRWGDHKRYHRAVIPASHFYEWNSKRRNIHFKRKDRSVLYLAGFFDLIDNEECFIILTTEANASMRAVHGRMPLILQEDQIEDWLRDGKVTEEILRQVPMELVRTAKYEQMTLFPM